MKAERNYPRYTVTAKAEAAILRGHPWVYDAEITATEGQAENGGLVDVISKKGRYLGTGFLSEHSKIRVRLLSRNANDRFDEAFWRRKLQWAWEYRKSVMALEDLDACRIIFGEADAFPGLTVDKFHDLLSVQVLSVGMERIQDVLLPPLVRTAPGGRLPHPGRVFAERRGPAGKGGPVPGEGMVPSSRRGDPGLSHHGDHGKRREVPGGRGERPKDRLLPGPEVQPPGGGAHWPGGKTVLDCFTHTGSFALNAALGGAKPTSPPWTCRRAAVEMARANAARNGLYGMVDCVAANVFDLLPAPGEGADATMTSSSWTRRPSPSPERPWPTPSPDTRRSTTGP